MKIVFAFILFCIIISASAQLPLQGLSATKPLPAPQPVTINLHPDEKKPLDSARAYPVERLISQMKPIRKEIGTIVVLHPSLGSVITLDEKKEFGLFPEQPDNTFENAQLIKYNDSTYTIFFHIADGRESEKLISTNEILALYLQVESIKPAPPVQETKQQPPNFAKGATKVLDVFGSVLIVSVKALILIADRHGHGPSSLYTDDFWKYQDAR